jgi:hypothetical protein
LLEGFDGVGERCAAWFAEQQVYMVGHDHVGVQAKLELTANAFESSFEYLFCFWFCEKGTAMPAAEGDKVCLSGCVKALESRRHAGSLTAQFGSLKNTQVMTVSPLLKPKEGLNGPFLPHSSQKRA